VSGRQTAARALAEWSTGLDIAGLPAEVRDALCLHALDGIGCALAAGSLGAAAPALAVAGRFAGDPEARWIGSQQAVAAPAAALASGVLVHALDFDDTHPGALVHPSAAVLPGALAVAEETGADGSQLLEALAVGYEVVVRLGTAARHGFHARGLHATSVCGVMATALVASRLYGLSTEATVDAVGIAGSQAGGLLEFLHTGASTKQLHPGLAAQGGVTAARLAAAGASGPDSVLEGPYGLYEALAGREVANEAVTDGLGERFLLLDTVVKPYPACHLFHAALDAAMETAGKLAGTGVDPTRIEAVTVDVAPDAVPIVCEPAATKMRPRTPYEAKFSLAWSVAAMLIDGSVTLATYDDPGLRPDVAALAERVSYRVVPFDGPVADAPQRVVTRDRGDGSELDTCADPRSWATEPERRRRVTHKLAANLGDGNEIRALSAGVLGLADLAKASEVLDLAAEACA
jgi:2-methylcitrate dehydratase PrpD